ncbi:hypothetical protein CYY_001386 [Polysphondylium violaceum]|uniref:ATP adenylyltransferase n=1 Tax=Polysphondylium violaceum TaxID=133409 RepID=A0A8J4Q239_9MYCE|nr:hypothetical protein CYY_001386 [Polysphondylium violaceum]
MSSMALWDKIKKVSERATQIGAIEKIESSPLFINENGIKFMVSVAKSLLKRPFNFQKSISTENISSLSNSNNINNSPKEILQPPKKFIDPFLPCDKDLFVQELCGTHNLVLNKFNVSNYHSIIATKEYEKQTDPLNRYDFKAIWECIIDCNMLCFFNCGPSSGASQPHKHVQLLVTPFHTCEEKDLTCKLEQLQQQQLSDIDNDYLKCPIESIIKLYNEPKETIFQVEQLPFKNACIYYQTDKLKSMDKDQISIYFEHHYRSLLNHLNLNSDQDNSSSNNINNIYEDTTTDFKSYNFIMTKEWMFMIPRSCYQAKGISINSVGFTGAILVRKEEELDTIKSYGIMNILKDVSFSK